MKFEIKIKNYFRLVLRTDFRDLPNYGKFDGRSFYSIALVARTEKSSKRKLNWNIIAESITIIAKVTISTHC